MKDKSSNKLLKWFMYLCIIISLFVAVLTIYNKNSEKKAIEAATRIVGKAFIASSEHPKNSNRIIVEKYLRDEKELLSITKEALPLLTTIGDYDVMELLSVRAYYGENKDNPQFYDVKFKDIKKIRWEMIRNFDDFLNEINKYK